MPCSQSTTVLDQLSDSLLRAGRLAREVPASEFLGQAITCVQELIGFSRGWWGMGTDNGKGQIPSIYQSEFINLPDDFAAEWRKIALVDGFTDGILSRNGQVQRWDECDEKDLPAETLEFDRRYDIHHTMGMVLDDAPTGHGFFIVVFRRIGEQAFSDDESVLLQHLMRHIVQLWQYSLQDALATASKDDIAHALLARMDGRVLYAGQKISELLDAEWPEWDGISLPTKVMESFASLPCTLRLSGGTIDVSVRDEHVWLVRTKAETEMSMLSPRERRVAQLFASGHSYKEIARQLKLTPSTVRTYLRDAYLRLGVRNKVQLGGALSDRSVRA